ncbi:tetratricopeptide repeat protein [bacterium]|nr:tetratricopeptide repeat protein [bacterium]
MKVTIAAMVCVLIAVVSGCSPAPKMKAEDYFKTTDSLVAQNKIEEGLKMLDDLAAAYPKDTAVIIKSWTAAADIYAVHLQNFPKAIESLQRIIDTYPETPQASVSLFKIGFTYETLAHDMEKAKTVYEEFLKKYPQHELAESVKISLDHLGESDEELLERILNKNEKLDDKTTVKVKEKAK